MQGLSTSVAATPWVRIVGIGASAGGLDALERFFSSTPIPCGLAFVVVQHLSPDHKSLMVELLARRTTLPVSQALDGQRVEADHIYLVPPAKRLSLEHGAIRLEDKERGQAGAFTIDSFFESLAASLGERAVAIVLSGTGTDGTLGVRAVKQVGGLVFAQDPASAQFDGMPRSAIESGTADFILTPEAMPRQLMAYFDRLESGPLAGDGIEQEALLSELLGQLELEVEVDFRDYKRATIERRVKRRMAARECGTLAAYVELARAEAGELRALYKELLIGVTRFFRDPQAFEALREHVLRPLVAEHDSAPIRMWVAGCATGEEAYSIAILLRELLDEACSQREVKIFATDLDQSALAIAAFGAYPRAAVDGISERRLACFFTLQGEKFVVSQRIRSMVLFANHNLLRSPPFTRLDLVSCRNVLIYFEPALQQNVLATLHFALKGGGKLMLGPSENLGVMADSFSVLDAKYRLFQSSAPVRVPLDRGASGLRMGARNVPSPARVSPSEEARVVQAASQLMLSDYAPSALLVDESLQLLHVFGRPIPFLRVASGSASLNLLRLVDGAMAALLGSAVPRAFSSGKESVYYGLHLEGIPSELSIRVRVIATHDGSRRAALIVFERDAGLPAEGLVEAVRVQPDNGKQLEELRRELELSRETLQVTVEELQTSNEELQATNEELLSANEELQSTNEELHSTNEELHTINAEYARKNQELGDLNSDIDNLLRSTNIGTVFLDAQLRVRKFTPAVSEYIPLLDRDVGRPLRDLAFHSASADLLGEARAVLEGRSSGELPFDAAGRHALVRVLPYVDPTGRVEGVVITFVDITSWKSAVLRTQRILDSLRQQVALLDREGAIVLVNRAWTRFAASNGGDASYLGWNYLAACEQAPGDELAVRAATGIRAVLSGQGSDFEMEYPCHAPDQQRWFLLHAAAVDESGGAVISHVDITERKRAELALQEQAILDPLTALLNRRGIEQELARLVGAAQRSDEWPGVVFIDCDDFKRVNDALGHATGDVVLQEVARRLREALRPADRLARIGGDEFLVLLPGARLAEAGQVAERLRKTMAAQPVALSHGPLTLTISAAVLAADERLQSVSELTAAARGALRSAKVHGRNRVFARSRAGDEPVEAYEAGTLEALMERDEAFGTLRHALVRLGTGDIVGFEYLTRGPHGPFHLPIDLFHAASDLGVLTSIDLMCLRLCLKRSRMGTSGALWHHVNLYPSTLLDTSLERLAALFPRDVPQGTYCVELSEQQILGDPSTMLEHVANLRRLGVRVAIDDVGFGRTSLETLVLIEPEVLKIDRRCVAGVAGNTVKARSLERLLRVARSLDALVIAEGVETAQDARVLADMGIQYAQGFYFAQPEALVA